MSSGCAFPGEDGPVDGDRNRGGNNQPDKQPKHRPVRRVQPMRQPLRTGGAARRSPPHPPSSVPSKPVASSLMVLVLGEHLGRHEVNHLSREPEQAPAFAAARTSGTALIAAAVNAQERKRRGHAAAPSFPRTNYAWELSIRPAASVSLSMKTKISWPTHDPNAAWTLGSTMRSGAGARARVPANEDV